MLKSTCCPELDAYRKLTGGQLSVADTETLLRHLETCDSCAGKIHTLPASDLLIDWLGQIKSSASASDEKQLGPLMERLIQLAKPSASPSVVLPSTLRFSCSGCGKPLRVKAEAAGKKVKCPHCGQVIPAPPVAGTGGSGVAPVGSVGMETVDLASAAGGTSKASPPSETPTLAAGPSGKERELCSFLAPSQAPDELGRLGPYRVLKVLGAGGMGVVFRAEDPQLQRVVAIKAMLPALAANESARQRFLREARLAASLKHDHVVTIHQVGEDRGAPFLAMEFLDGEALEDRLKRESKLPLAEVLQIGREIANGLEAAHEHGLIHRDIKPANVWLEGKRGRVKILDFGLARSSGEDVHLTQSGAIVGTPAYMPPEQARGEKVDARCDLYSLGCVLYRLCTGQLPFKGDNTMSLLLALATESPKPVRELNTDIPPALADLIMRLLSKEPSQRPATAGEVAQALQDIAEAKPLASSSAPAAAPPRRRRRLPWAVAAGGLVLAALLTIIIIRLGKPEEGTIVIETVDPSVELVFKGGGQDYIVRDKKTGEEIQLPLGSYQVALQGGKEGLKLETNQFTLKRGERVLVKVTRQIGTPAAARANIAAPAQVPEHPWVVYEGSGGPGEGKHIVLISGDEEYRSEEALPQLGKILAKHHGFKCTVLFAIDSKDGTINPGKNDNIPGLEHLKNADLMILFTRFRNLPDQQMKHIAEYVDAGKPILGLRTATHAFNLKSPTYGKYSWTGNEEWKNGFGQQILGETWVDHWGGHGSQSTRGLLVQSQKSHPILRGIKDGDIWGPTDVYEVHLPLGGDSKPLALGQVLKGMKPNDPPADGTDARKNDPMMPIAWTKTYKSATGKTGRVFTTTMGASQDLESEGLRRLLVNAAYWAIGMEDKVAAKSNAAIVGEYKPLPFGISGYKKGVKPADLAAERRLPPTESAVSPLDALDPAWLKQMAALPPDKQVEAVAAKLKERNSGFDVGSAEPLSADNFIDKRRKGHYDFDRKVVSYVIEDGKVARLAFWSENVTDLSPLRALKDVKCLVCPANQGSQVGKGKLTDLSPLKGLSLTELQCQGTSVFDLSPLRGMPLTYLDCNCTKVFDLSPLAGMPLTELIFWGTSVSDLSPLKGMPLADLTCGYTPVSDLSPLAGMPLVFLGCNGTKVADLAPVKRMPLLTSLQFLSTPVSDLSPLKGMPLKTLYYEFKPERDVAILRSIKTLENINDKSAAEFWKEVDAKAANKKP